jgi:NitT/TauT family transport system permease protein
MLGGWQWANRISWLRDISVVFDPFFVSSPEKVSQRIYQLMFPDTGQLSVWPYLFHTIEATFFGVAIGTAVGILFGLLLSSQERVWAIVRPYVSLANAAPRIALIPVFVILFGPTMKTSVVTAFTLVVFIVFYNAYGGGKSVPLQTLQNAKLLGASQRELMWHVRFPYVLAWVFASFPNAISFGLIAVVTAELLTGGVGMGRLLAQSLSLADATLTFSVVAILSVFGVIIVTTAETLQRRVLHWWR